MPSANQKQITKKTKQKKKNTHTHTHTQTSATVQSLVKCYQPLDCTTITHFRVVACLSFRMSLVSLFSCKPNSCQVPFTRANAQWVIHGLSSTLIYTSELILCSTICVPSATRHNIHMYPYFLFAAIHHLKSSPTFSVRPCSCVGRVTVDLIRRSWVRFPPRSKDFFLCLVWFPVSLN